MVSTTRAGGTRLTPDERRWLKVLSTLNEAVPLALTQRQVAESLGCDVKVVNRIVNGRTSVSADLLLAEFVARRGEFGKSCSRESRAKSRAAVLDSGLSTLDSFAAPPQSVPWLRRSRAMMALKLGAAFRTTPEFWLNAQKASDLHEAARHLTGLPRPLLKAS